MNYFYGGAFNPMTKAHLRIIQDTLNEVNVNDLLIIGITNHDYKNYSFSFELRKKILEENLSKYIDQNKNVIILEQNQRTWKFLSNKSEFRPLTIVLGGDEYDDLKAMNIWHYSKELLENFQFKVFNRSNDVDGISSTKVRELLTKKVSFDILEKYITKETYELII